MLRLTADLFNNLWTIEYELNYLRHGQDWYQRSDLQRAQLWEDDLAEKFDLVTMAAVDGDLALAQVADGGSPLTSIAVFKNLVDVFEEPANRAAFAAN